MVTPPRDVLSWFWSPLTAVGAAGGGRPNAQICLSVFGASIVPERPRVLAVLSKTNYTHDLVAAEGRLSVTLLGEGQIGLLERLGLHSGRDGDKLAGLDVALTPSGCPWFPACAGWIEGDVIQDADLGDSTAFLVAVRQRETMDSVAPLPWAAARERVGEDFLRRWAEKSAREQEAARAAMRWR